jgi:sec-independent protein translocase protein TatC
MTAESASSPTRREDEATPGSMSLFEHLEELRKRLLFSAGGILVAFLACWWQSEILFAWCVLPYHEVVGEELSVIALGEGFLIHVRVAFIIALFLSAPWWLWQVWAFVRPGLYPSERRLAIPFLLLTTAFFLLGGWFAYEIGLPAILDFLMNKSAEGFEKDVRAENYIATFGRVLIAMGVVFEAPVLTFFLARLGLVTHRFLVAKARIATIVIFVVAAVITPSGDVPTLLVFALPMLALYWVSVLVALVFRRRPA